MSRQESFDLEDRRGEEGLELNHLSGRAREGLGDGQGEARRCLGPKPPKGCFDVSRPRVTQLLKGVERKVKGRHRASGEAAPDLAESPLGLVTQSEGMRSLLAMARRVAEVDAIVLITGESGSGKERVARLVHEASTRASGPFIAVNCGAITETLLESELFGHARGAFTGATLDRPGLFEAAHQGTLLLDEIAEVPPAMQVKLLRAIQEREVRRVGENKTRKVDVRILAATNRDLARGVAEGTFRQDLYYRLKVVELNVPPLRQRREDILPLARLLLAASALGMNRKFAGFSAAAAEHLLRYDWPGNVRELENAMARAVALGEDGRVELGDLPEEVRGAASKPVPLPGRVPSLEEVVKDYILTVLDLNGGNQAHTSQQLQIGAATLYRKLKSYGLGAGCKA